METITLSSNTAHNLKNRYQKFLKVCSLFNSKMEFVANQNFFDVKSDSGALETLGVSDKLSLHITGEDECQAALLIRSCIDC